MILLWIFCDELKTVMLLWLTALIMSSPKKIGKLIINTDIGEF